MFQQPHYPGLLVKAVLLLCLEALQEDWQLGEAAALVSRAVVLSWSPGISPREAAEPRVHTGSLPMPTFPPHPFLRSPRSLQGWELRCCVPVGAPVPSLSTRQDARVQVEGSRSWAAVPGAPCVSKNPFVAGCASPRVLWGCFAEITGLFSVAL